MRVVATTITAVLAVTAVIATAASHSMWDHFDGTAQVTNRDGTISYRGSHGFFNVPHKIPSYHDAQFPIASNTKLFTAVALYQLQERGLVVLTEPITSYLNATDFANFGIPNVTEYCPRLWNDTTGDCQPPSFRNLLSMSSGIYAIMRCDPQAGVARYCNPDSFIVYPGSIAAMVGKFILNPLGFAPGTSYEYSNPNFILAAYFIEKLSGMSYGDYIKQNILDVVGMPNTYFDPYNNQFAMNTNRVSEHHRFVDAATNSHIAFGQNTVDFDLGSLSGTGGLVSTIADMEKWYRTLFNYSSQGAPLLNMSASFALLLAPFTAMTPPALVPTFYTQGVIVACAVGDTQCFNGPAFIIYEGGTLVVHTANIFDVRKNATTGERAYQMTQVFSNSVRFNTSKALYNAARTKGTGNFFQLAAEIAVAPTLDAMGMAWELQALYGAPVITQ